MPNNRYTRITSKLNNLFLKYIIFVFCLFFTQSCAFTTAHIKLNYGVPVSQKIVAKNVHVYINKIEDSRTMQKIGIKKNGYGKETADILADGKVTNWIYSAFSRELKTAGFILVPSDEKYLAAITLDIKEFFVEPKVGKWSSGELLGRVELNITLRFADGSTFRRLFVGLSKRKINFYTVERMHDGLVKAVNNLCKKAIPEIWRLIRSKYYPT